MFSTVSSILGLGGTCVCHCTAAAAAASVAIGHESLELKIDIGINPIIRQTRWHPYKEKAGDPASAIGHICHPWRLGLLDCIEVEFVDRWHLFVQIPLLVPWMLDSIVTVDNGFSECKRRMKRAMAK